MNNNANDLITDLKEVSQESGYFCNARTKQETSKPRCTQRAGWRTHHPGTGRCLLHGGASRAGSESPQFRTGKYAKGQSRRVTDLIAHYEDDPEPLDLLGEVALLRALTHDLIERWDAIYGEDGALMAWHESYKHGHQGRKPRQLPDISAIGTISEKIGGLVERIHKFESERSLTVIQLTHIMKELGVQVARSLADVGLPREMEERLLKTIEARWRHIQVEPSKRSGRKRQQLTP